MEQISIQGARENNLKNIQLTLPIGKIICFHGPSGCGKTSLAFRTLHKESKRRFLSSLSNKIRFYAEKISKADVDEIKPLLPTFALEQHNPIVGSRHNVADLMTITERIQSLFFLDGVEHCSSCGGALKEQGLLESLNTFFETQGIEGMVHIFIKPSDFSALYSEDKMPLRVYSLEKQEISLYQEASAEETWYEIFKIKTPDLQKRASLIEKIGERELLIVAAKEKKSWRHSLEQKWICMGCQKERKRSRNLIQEDFSPLSALGACKKCNGHGDCLEYSWDKITHREKSLLEGGCKVLEYAPIKKKKNIFFTELEQAKINLKKNLDDFTAKEKETLWEGTGKYPGVLALLKKVAEKRYRPSVRIFLRSLQIEKRCPLCAGTRLQEEVFHTKIAELSYKELWLFNLQELFCFLDKNKNIFTHKTQLQKIIHILERALKIGLGELALTTKVKSLSSGEYQRILMLKYLSYEGSGALFVFDEPTVGLSLVEQKSLWNCLQELKKQDNTVIMIEHSDFVRNKSDYEVEMGPSSGIQGGNVLYSGPVRPKKIFYDKKNLIEIKKYYQGMKSPSEALTLKKHESAKKIYPSFKIYSQRLNWFHAPSSWKIFSYLQNRIEEAENTPFHQFLFLPKESKRAVRRATIGSALGLIAWLRKHYISLPSYKSMSLKEGHLSYYSELGQCPECKGRGKTIIEMQYVEDIELTCEYCDGEKLKREFASLSDGKFTFHQALNAPIQEVFHKKTPSPSLTRVLKMLEILNLGHLALDREISTLSGGERQRLGLLTSVLSLKKRNQTLLAIESPSFGLSASDLLNIFSLMKDFLLQEMTILVVDHHPLWKEVAHYETTLS